METFFALLALCAGNSSVTGEFPTQRPVTRSFERKAGDLRRHRAHYDVTVMDLIKVQMIAFKKMHMKCLSAKLQSFLFRSQHIAMAKFTKL